MRKKLFAFTINTLDQAENIILESKIYKTTPILYFKNYLLKGFGSEFVITFRDILISKFGRSSFKLFVDCGFDNGLTINLITKKIDFIKVSGSSIIYKKLKNIANENRVLLNPSFNIVDCRKRKNIDTKLKKIYS